MAKEVLVIGGAGLIGSGLVEELVRKKHKVTVMDRGVYGFNGLARVNMSLAGYPREQIWASSAADLTRYIKGSNFNIIEGDTRKPDDITKALQKSKARTVYHLGEYVGIARCNLDPEDTRENNLIGTSNVFRAVRQSGLVEFFIYNSTSSVYFRGKKLFTENSLLPDRKDWDEYTANKILAEHEWLRLVSGGGGPQWLMLRPATICGGSSPRQRLDLFVSNIAYSLLTTGCFSLANPQDMRAIMDVQDAVGFLASLPGRQAWKSDIYNMGDLNLSKIAIASLVAESLGMSAEEVVKIVPVVGDNRSLTIDSSALIREFGYSPGELDPLEKITRMVKPMQDLYSGNKLVFAQGDDPLLVAQEHINATPEGFRRSLGLMS